MKYVVGIFIFIAGFIGASAAMGSLPSLTQSNSYVIDYETATIEERAHWLHNEASEIERSLASSLKQVGKKNEVEFSVSGSHVDVDQRRIDVSLQMSGHGTLLMSQTEARELFVKKTCPTYKRSTLGDAQVILRVTVLDARGGQLMQFLNSPRKCELFS